MEEQIAELLEHMAKSHEELARALKAGRDMAVHLSGLVLDVPDERFVAPNAGREAVVTHALDVAANVVSYLKSIADLEDAAAESLEPVMRELHGDSSEE